MKKAAENVLPVKNESRQMITILGIAFLAIFIGVSLFLKIYDGYNDRLLYAERLKQMQEVTEQLFNGLEDVINNQWKASKLQCNYLENEKPETMDDLLEWMDQQFLLNELDEKEDQYVAVDSAGRYYT